MNTVDILNLKTNIFERIGQKIIVKGSLGRNRSFEKEATMEKAYPEFFMVKYNGGLGVDKETYTYKDILTRRVEVQVLSGDTYSPLIPPETVEKTKKKIKV